MERLVQGKGPSALTLAAVRGMSPRVGAFNRAVHTKGFDDAMLRARSQAEGYARAAGDGRTPTIRFGR